MAATASIAAFSQPKAADFPYDIKYYMPAEVTEFDPNVPTPREILGFEVGQQHADWGNIVNYMKELERTSPRVSMIETGRTYEFRPIIEVVITSEENQKKLEQIRQEHLLLSDPEQSDKLDTDKMPSVVKLNYSIHGNESSGYNASLPVAYLFAAGKSPKIDEILENCIIVLCPGANPDGHNRFSNYVNYTRSNTDVSDLNSWEFTEVWPVARGNHYFVDCNRDYLSVQHPESVNAVEGYLRWRPNIMTDHHEQGAARTFYYSPGEKSRIHPLLRKDVLEVTGDISKNVGKEFDKIHSGYYSGEGYDNYFIGKGSAYGTMHGSLCLLYEQGQVRGHLRDTSNGLRSFPWTVRNQAISSYGTVLSGLEMRKQLLDYQRDFYKEAAAEAAKGDVKGYVFDSRGNKGLMHHFLKMMKVHDLDIYSLSKDLTVNGKKFSAKDSYIIPIDQKESKMVRTMMDTMDEFEDSVFYDISAWTFPIAYNLKYEPVKSTSGLLGKQLEKPVFEEGKVIGGKSDIGYLFDNTELYSHKVIYDLLSAGAFVNISNTPITIETEGGKKKLGYGTVQVMASNQPISSDSIYNIISKSAKEAGVTVYATHTSDLPDIDLTSPSFSPVHLPKVAVLANEGYGGYGYDTGEVWFHLDRRFQMKPVMIKKNNLTEKVLKNYNVIIIPNGVPNLTAGGEEALKHWVAAGGTLIATGKADGYLKKLGVLDLKTRKPVTYNDSAKYLSYEHKRATHVTNPISGVILNCHIDKTHPLGWGFDQDEIPVMKIRKGNTVYLPDPSSPYVSPMHYTKKPRLSGFISPANEKLISNTPAVFVKPYKSGKVIYFADNPLFRSHWLGTSKIFMNAIFFNNAM